MEAQNRRTRSNSTQCDVPISDLDEIWLGQHAIERTPMACGLVARRSLAS